uniref:Uncharacterized protein n=1 Tax=Arundo donax TaxID=35708 RepID=A0A0A9AFE1_ARUDO
MSFNKKNKRKEAALLHKC